MTELQITGEWVEWDGSFENETWFAETNDPRVLAVIQRDPDYPMEWALDGDLICPTYYHEWITWGREYPDYRGGFQDDEIAHAWGRARSEFSARSRAARRRWWPEHEALRRYMLIFHGTVYSEVSGGGDQSGQWVVFSTPDLREKCGNDRDLITEDQRAAAQADVDGWAREVGKILDGDVWSVGTAVNEGRLLPDVEVGDMDGWDIEIECGGFIGEEYAKSEALSYGGSMLAEMIDLGGAA